MRFTPDAQARTWCVEGVAAIQPRHFVRPLIFRVGRRRARRGLTSDFRRVEPYLHSIRKQPLHHSLRYAVCSATVVNRLTLSIAAARGESWGLIDALRSLMVPTRRERGCISCQLVLSSESSDPMRIWYVEDWSSEAALREQVRSDRFLRCSS